MQRACWCLTINPGQALYPRCNVPSAVPWTLSLWGPRDVPRRWPEAVLPANHCPTGSNMPRSISPQCSFAILYIKLNARVILSRKYITSDGKG